MLGFDGTSLLWTVPGNVHNDGIWTLAGGSTYFGGNVGIGGVAGTSKLTITAPDALTVAGAGGPYITWKDTNTGLSAAISSANGALYFRVPLGAAIKTAGYFDGNGLVVNGRTALSTGGSGGDITFGTPNGESGLTMLGTNRADLRFDGTTLRMLVGPLGGPPPATGGIAVGTAGAVGIGTSPNNTSSLAVVGSYRGIFSGGDYAISGQGQNGAVGVFGTSDTSRGVSGTSNTGTGVSGYSASSDGVTGTSNGAGDGIYGFSNTGYGVNAASASGTALNVIGHARQSLEAGGFAKAMIVVREDGTILRGFNSFLNGSPRTTAPCGFSVQVIKGGLGNLATLGYVIDFGFRVDDRFASVSPSPPSNGLIYGNTPQGTNPNKLWLSGFDSDFTVIIY